MPEVLTQAQRDAYEILPTGIVSMAELAQMDDWIFELDLERLMFEASQLPESSEGQRLAKAITPAAVVEDGTRKYVEFPNATRTIAEDPVRSEFINKTWFFQELTHGLFSHAVADAAQGLTESARELRNKEAERLVSISKRVSDIFVRRVVAKVAPDTMAGFVESKGMTNEKNPEFLYTVFRSIAHRLGFTVLAEGYDIKRSQEKMHGGKYRNSLKNRLEDLGVRRNVRWLMERHQRMVGHELLTQDDMLHLSNFFDPSDPEHMSFMNDADDRFEDMPGMEGVRPFQAGLLAYRPNLKF